MKQALTLTTPVFVPNDGVLFSAYGVGRGYCGFTLTAAAARQQLGAADYDSQQVLLAFRLNQPRIARAIEAKELPDDGRRVKLDVTDFD